MICANYHLKKLVREVCMCPFMVCGIVVLGLLILLKG